MKIFELLLTLKNRIPDKVKKLSKIFIFTLLCGASKVYEGLHKPFEATERSVKIKILLNFFTLSRIGLFNFYFNITFRNERVFKGEKLIPEALNSRNGLGK